MKRKMLLITGLTIEVDAYGDDPVEEARRLLRLLNDVVFRKVGGSPFLAPAGADIIAEYDEREDGLDA